MPRIRQIKPDFYLDDDLALCSREARLLFPGLWMLADRAGRLEDRPARIKVQIFPYDQDISPKEIGVFLDELASHCFITRYQAAGKNVIQIRTFEKHQHCHRKEPDSQLPPPEELTEKPGKYRASPENTGPAPDEPGKIPSSPAASGVLSIDNGLLSVGAASGEKLLDWSNTPSKPKPALENHPPAPASRFFLTDELRIWTETFAPDVDPETEAEKFRDYYGRNGKTFADLSAAWRKWIRDAITRDNRIRAPAYRESAAERTARAFREVEAEDRARAQHGGKSP